MEKTPFYFNIQRINYSLNKRNATFYFHIETVKDTHTHRLIKNKKFK